MNGLNNMKKQATAKNEDMHKIVITALLLKSDGEVVIDDKTWQQAKLLCANDYYLERTPAGRVVGIVPF